MRVDRKKQCGGWVSGSVVCEFVCVCGSGACSIRGGATAAEAQRRVHVKSIDSLRSCTHESLNSSFLAPSDAIGHNQDYQEGLLAKFRGLGGSRVQPQPKDLYQLLILVDRRRLI